MWRKVFPQKAKIYFTVEKSFPSKEKYISQWRKFVSKGKNISRNQVPSLPRLLPRLFKAFEVEVLCVYQPTFLSSTLLTFLELLKASNRHVFLIRTLGASNWNFSSHLLDETRFTVEVGGKGQRTMILVENFDQLNLHEMSGILSAVFN